MNWFKRLLGLKPSPARPVRRREASPGRPLDRSERFNWYRQRIDESNRLLKPVVVEPRQPVRKPQHPEPFRFLGFGVSTRLRKDDGQLDRLREWDLPEWQTPAELAAGLGITERQLHWLAYFRTSVRSTHYIYFEIEKASGATRTLSAPRPLMAACQRLIKSEILDRLPVHEAAHGFVAGEKHLDVGVLPRGTRPRRQHGSARLFSVDPICSGPRLVSFTGILFERFDTSNLLCTDVIRTASADSEGTMLWTSQTDASPSLPQGACTSPAISNLICHSFDRRVSGLVNKLGWTWTRYADDLTFSANLPEAESVGYLMHRVRGLAAESGFKIAEGKTRIQRRHQRQSVTGLTVNDRVSVNRKTVRRVRAILHQASKTGLSSQNRDNHPDFAGYLQGLIAHIASANPEMGAKLIRKFDEVTNGA